MHLPDIVEYLEEQDTASIESTDFYYHELCQVVINSLRILAQTEREMYDDILRDGLGDTTIACIANDTSQVREELGIIQNLQLLYQELRLMKLEGKVYDVLDEFFNEQLYRTL